METTFLATVLGWYLIIFSLFLLFRSELAKVVIADILAQRGLFSVLAIITIVVGLLMVVSHNIWVNDWPVAVTLFAWLTVVGGVIRLFCPEIIKKRGTSFINHPVRMKIVCALVLFFGLYLLFHVYYHG